MSVHAFARMHCANDLRLWRLIPATLRELEAGPLPALQTPLPPHPPSLTLERQKQDRIQSLLFQLGEERGQVGGLLKERHELLEECQDLQMRDTASQERFRRISWERDQEVGGLREELRQGRDHLARFQPLQQGLYEHPPQPALPQQPPQQALPPCLPHPQYPQQPDPYAQQHHATTFYYQ